MNVSVEDIHNVADTSSIPKAKEKLKKPKSVKHINYGALTFYSFLRFTILPSDLTIKMHSVKISSPKDSFSVQQKSTFSNIFPISATDSSFLNQSLNIFHDDDFLIVIITGNINIQHLFSFFGYESAYIFEYDSNLFSELINNHYDLSQGNCQPITQISSSSYFTPKLHFLQNKHKKLLALFLPFDYLTNIRQILQIASKSPSHVNLVLLSQIDETYKDKYTRIIPLLSLHSATVSSSNISNEVLKSNENQQMMSKQLMLQAQSSPAELSGIFETIGSIISRNNQESKQIDSELVELEKELNSLQSIHQQTLTKLKENEKKKESIQNELTEAKKKRIDLLNEKERLSEFVKRSISLTCQMKEEVARVVDRSNSYARKVEEVTQNEIINLEAEAFEKMKSQEIFAEMEMLQSEIDHHLKSLL